MKKLDLNDIIIIIAIIVVLFSVFGLGIKISINPKNKKDSIEFKDVKTNTYKNHTYLSIDENIIHDPDCEFCKKNGDF